MSIKLFESAPVQEPEGVKVREDLFFYGPYSNFMLKLYVAFSVEQYPRSLVLPNPSWDKYIDEFYRMSAQEAPYKTYDENLLPKCDLAPVYKKAVVGFSGGKDSVAQLALCLDNGISCDLVNMASLNKAFPGELQAVHNIAQHTGCKLEEIKFGRQGKDARVENPIKNHMIMGYMVDYMIKNQITFATMGLHLTDDESNIPSNGGLSDNYPLTQLLVKAIQETFPSFQLFISFRNITHTTSFLAEYHPDLLQLCQSCMLPDRYRGSIRAKNEEKFGMEIMKNCCFSCYKCCAQYLMLSHLGIISFSEEAHKHIEEQLRKDVWKVMGDNPTVTSESPIDEIVGTFIEMPKMLKYAENKEEILKAIDYSGLNICKGE